MTTTTLTTMVECRRRGRSAPRSAPPWPGAGIIDASEQADVLAGRRRFTVDEYLAMEVAGILYEVRPG